MQYWNWFKYQEDLSQSPVFDGSDTSFGGDGEFFAHNGSIAGQGKVWIPSGKGVSNISCSFFTPFSTNPSCFYSRYVFLPAF